MLSMPVNMFIKNKFQASEYKQRVNDLTYQMQVLEDELGDAKLQCSKVNASSMAQKSNYEIAVN